MTLEYKVYKDHLMIRDGCRFANAGSNIISAKSRDGHDTTKTTSNLDSIGKKIGSNIAGAFRSLLYANVEFVRSYYMELASDLEIKCPQCNEVYHITRDDFRKALGDKD